MLSRGSLSTLVLSFLAFAFLTVSAPALTRVPNNSIDVPLSPPLSDFVVAEAFGTLSFPAPVALVTPAGETNRLFVLEQSGMISVVTNLANPNRTVFLDISARVMPPGTGAAEQGLLGLAFHPQYASNGFFYVFYTGTDNTTGISGRHDILSRFQVSTNNPNQADPNSEMKLIHQYDEASNHNGGDLHFGPDGYLYASLGDEGGGNDSYNNSQRIDKDFFSGILRIDVDKRPASLAPNSHPSATTNYAVPPDNPYIGATNFNGSGVNSNAVRTEFYAVGLRNPWRMSFDPATGELLCGDVGQSAREEINRIVKGGNYGWAYREGTIAGPKSAQTPPGFTGIEPLLDYTRGAATNQGYVVTGGVTYRGSKIQQLFAAYIFTDYGSGHIWAVRHDGTTALSWEWLATQLGISAFGTDPRNGDVLLAVQTANRIRRLVATNSIGTPLPMTLADTGVFSDLQTLTPRPGVVPYDLNVPFWSDNAIKTRWFSLPDTNQVIDFSMSDNWSFPTGTVWVKHFELELTNGVPASRHRVETRMVMKNQQGIHGFTYRWGQSTTNAALVAAEGMDESFVIDAGGGLLRTQVWHYPSRSECLACHTAAGGYGLGFNTAQLNRSFDMGEGVENQVQALSEAGYFAGTVSNLHLLPMMPALSDETVSREHRVRAYLAANCVQCHSPGGPAPAFWDARFATPTAQAGIIDGGLVDNGGDDSSRVVMRGSLELSAALQRISKRGAGQMPPLDSTIVDTQAVALLSEWILNDLPAYEFFPEWQVSHFGSTNAAGAGAKEDYDGDGDNAYLEFLNHTNPKLASSRWRLTYLDLNPAFFVLFNRIANRGYELQFTDDPAHPKTWAPLDSAWNSPTFLSTDTIWSVPDGIDTAVGLRLYRVRVYER